jgi:hypothetical protein
MGNVEMTGGVFFEFFPADFDGQFGAPVEQLLSSIFGNAKSTALS